MICPHCHSEYVPVSERAQNARNWLRLNLTWQFTGHGANGAIPPTDHDQWWVWSMEHLEREIKDDAAAIAMYEQRQRR